MRTPQINIDAMSFIKAYKEKMKNSENAKNKF
jgi:hypothetical protein